jgi:DNA-binding MarR family transcriptional regulator
MRKAMSLPEQSKAVEVAACTCFNLRKATRAVTQLYDDTLRPSGLRATQFSLLTVIWIMGKVSITRLAEEAVMDRTTLARNLDLLEEQGLVRIQAGDDARVREVSLTPAGHNSLTAAFPYWKKAQALVTKNLGPGRVDRLLADLSAAVAAAQKQ